MRILVTGGNGQLGRELRLLAPLYRDHEFTFIDIGDLDLTDRPAVETYFREGSFSGIINCAAYTAVDKAEAESGTAFQVNAVVPSHLAALASSTGAGIIHISTDYVFDGKKSGPYTESDIPNPVSAYGKSKYQGEQEVIRNGKKGAILRTSWLYSPFGSNFVKTILSKARLGNELRIVSDKAGCPTYAHDLAKTLLDLLPFLLQLESIWIYHYSNEGATNWFEFAGTILSLAGISCQVVPIFTGDYPAAAARPMNAVMSKEKIRKEFGITIPDWKESLGKCLARF